MNPIKKTIYTLACNGYSPDICEITFPYLKRYADKIGADFFVIQDRKFPDYPATYEKNQIHELARERQDDWAIFFDADVLVHPAFIDVTGVVGKDTVVIHDTVCSANFTRLNEFHLRDGRMLGMTNWIRLVLGFLEAVRYPTGGRNKGYLPLTGRYSTRRQTRAFC